MDHQGGVDFGPLFDDLTYGLPSAPVEALLDGVRYRAAAIYDANADELDYRLTIIPPVTPWITVSAVYLGPFGRYRGARICSQGSRGTYRDTGEIADPFLRATVEQALRSVTQIGTDTRGAFGRDRRARAA